MTLVVRTYEMDGFRHVNNAVFAQYMEAARGAHVLAVGLEYADFHRLRAYPVVARLEAEYLAPAAADETLEIETRAVEMKRSRFVFEYEIRRADGGELVFRGRTVHAFVTPEGKITRAPEEIRAAFGFSSGTATDTSPE